MVTSQSELAARISGWLLERNQISREFFEREAMRLAEACREMSERFLRGGRILAFGRGSCATDAAHVAVEFVHPVIVGKRALPALDLSGAPAAWLAALIRPDDIVMGFATPNGCDETAGLLEAASRRGAMTFALPGTAGTHAIAPPSDDPFISQEIFEVLYHTLWETVHVYFEHRELGEDIGAAGFLYPFLGESRQDTASLVDGVAASIVAKARDDERMREEAARDMAPQIASAAMAIHERIAAGGNIITLGNGGSATDANDFMLDCVMPPPGYHSLPAISLAMEPAIISAVANDIGGDAIFLRQLIAHGQPNDVVITFSTSGGSRNIIAALEEARRQGLPSIALLGYDGGEIVRRGLADIPIVVRSDYIPRIQEMHASIYHVMRRALEVIAHGER